VREQGRPDRKELSDKPVDTQNFVEICFSIALLAINLTIFRWIQGEISDMVMSSDDTVIKTREQQDRLFKFVSVLSPELRSSIQNHFLAVQGNVSQEQEQLLAFLSHGLRVELARWVWREFLTKVYLFRGCSGQFLDALCVILHETHYGVLRVSVLVSHVTRYVCVCSEYRTN